MQGGGEEEGGVKAGRGFGGGKGRGKSRQKEFAASEKNRDRKWEKKEFPRRELKGTVKRGEIKKGPSTAIEGEWWSRLCG